MRKAQHARALAEFLAPALQNAPDVNAEPDSPDSCSCHEKVVGPAEPAVDFAIYLELHEAWRKGHPKGNGAAEQDIGKLSEHLTELLERDAHAVGVLSALLAGRGDQPQADAPQQPFAGPPGGRSEPGGRRASGSGSRSCLPPKTASGLRAPDIAAWLRDVARLLIWLFSPVSVVSVRVLASLFRKNR
jgi:hypothetical protein